MKDLVTPETLYNYFEKKATRREKQLIEEWLKQDGHEEIFYHHLAVWESKHLQVAVDTEKALARYQGVLAGNEPVRTIAPARAWRPMAGLMTRYAGLAAAVILLMAAAVFCYQHYYIYTTYSTAYGMTRGCSAAEATGIGRSGW